MADGNEEGEQGVVVVEIEIGEPRFGFAFEGLTLDK